MADVENILKPSGLVVKGLTQTGNTSWIDTVKESFYLPEFLVFVDLTSDLPLGVGTAVELAE